MNWKIFGVLVAGAGLLTACAASQPEPTMADPSEERIPENDSTGPTMTPAAKPLAAPVPPPPPPPPAPPPSAVMHE